MVAIRLSLKRAPFILHSPLRMLRDMSLKLFFCGRAFFRHSKGGSCVGQLGGLVGRMKNMKGTVSFFYHCLRFRIYLQRLSRNTLDIPSTSGAIIRVWRNGSTDWMCKKETLKEFKPAYIHHIRVRLYVRLSLTPRPTIPKRLTVVCLYNINI